MILRRIPEISSFARSYLTKKFSFSIETRGKDKKEALRTNLYLGKYQVSTALGIKSPSPACVLTHIRPQHVVYNLETFSSLGNQPR